jgi:hypothetical protein
MKIGDKVILLESWFDCPRDTIVKVRSIKAIPNSKTKEIGFTYERRNYTIPSFSVIFYENDREVVEFT